ncbi:MAG: YdcF family protein [Spirochaetaceae bacterium]|nr:YdcF family protein [Spirochaetaceae bacterium]
MILIRLAIKMVAAFVSLALLVLAVTAGLVWWTARQDDRRVSDAIVVLGAAQFDGRASSIFTARLVHARNLWRDDVAPRIITVGGNQVGDRFTEASAGKRWLIDHGVPARRIVVVPTGSDTLSSLSATQDRMQGRGWSTAVIVTDPWHVLRARSMASDQGIDAALSPTRRGPAVRQRSTEIRYIARESFAYLYWKIFHRSADSGPNAV